MDGNRRRLEQQLNDRKAFVQNHQLEQELLDGLVALGEARTFPLLKPIGTPVFLPSNCV